MMMAFLGREASLSNLLTSEGLLGQESLGHRFDLGPEPPYQVLGAYLQQMKIRPEFLAGSDKTNEDLNSLLSVYLAPSQVSSLRFSVLARCSIARKTADHELLGLQDYSATFFPAAVFHF